MKTRLFHFWRLLVALGLAAIPLTSSAPPMRAHSGIQGRAFLFQQYGSSMPYLAVPSVMLPVSATLSVYTVLGHRKVAQVVSDAEGMFDLALAPGKYVVVPETLPYGYFTSTANPIPVTVKNNTFTTVTVAYPWMNLFFSGTGSGWSFDVIVAEPVGGN